MSTDVAATIDRLRAAFDSGRTTDLAWRKRQLQGVIALLKENEAQLSAALTEDLGKPAFDSWLTELNLVKDEAAHALKHLGGWAKPTKHSVPLVVQPAKAWTEPQPLGVVLIIAPWNYPVQLLLAPAVAALAAGNAMVLKPSELAPATSAAMADLVPKYLDTDAVAVVEGGVPETTELLAQEWDHILYTGSTRVGQVVMEAAAKHLTPVTLELGGKSPTIIAADADLKVAAKRVAWAKILNAGQTCIAPDYLLVEASVSDRFASLVVDELAGFRDKAPATSIVNEHHLDRLEGLLDGHGGEELMPRKTDRDARVMAPVVVRQPDPSSAVMQEEIFGPILPMITVDSIDDAISFVRSRPRPLALYLFTSSGATERKVLDQTHAGSVCINHLVYQAAVTSLPFGGIGPSGMGAYHGKAGFTTFSHTKSVLKRPTRMDPGFAYPPYTDQIQKVLKFLTRW
ncbi:aldehyde dehydrogenase family protein [Aquihabitans daechungensis]|uniref:aldehyde dehydrogenase family protein n=1 Tax=Aquihabitans daechungensis TaxID=1052257 RepID=UPI003B9E8BA0